MEQQTFFEEKESTSGFDLKRYLSKLGANFYWILISMALFGALAFVLLRYSVPLYQVSTYILIQRPNDAITSLGGSAFAQLPQPSTEQSLAMLDPSNEIFKLKSNSLIGEVVDSLSLDVSVIKFGRIKNTHIAMDSLPVNIQVKKSHPDAESPLYKLYIYPSYYAIQWEKDSTQGYYGDPLVVRGDTILITQKESIASNSLYGLKFEERADAVNTLLKRLIVVPAPKAGPLMLQVTVQDELQPRAKEIIDVLINLYDLSNFKYKTRELRSEIEFLEGRLQAVNSELMQQENQVRDFKVANKVTDVTLSANALLGSINALDLRKSDIELKKYLVDLVETNVQKMDGNEQVISNSSMLGDAVLSGLVGKYNEKVLEKERILDRGTPMDPRLPALNKELQDLRVGILNSVKNVRQELEANTNYLAAEERAKTGSFQTMPEKEKDFTQVKRLLDIKQAMYIFLMQRKEDKHIQLISSQAGDSRVIDSRTSNDIIPDPLIVYAVALGLGILIPALVILIKTLLNKKVETRRDIENGTSLPIAGEIEIEPRTAKESIVSAGYRSDIAEQFRTLRTNLMYLKQGTGEKVLMITSAMTGEGKSFVSLNLANTLAITGKKVVLVEFDLRKPQLAKKLNIQKSPGMTDFLITDDMHPEDVLQVHPSYENLSFITCGPVPPNPGELILSKKVTMLFEYLRKNFDYVVVDTPPVGVISDAIVIGGHADLTLYVVRHQVSYRSSLQLLNELNRSGKVPHLSIIINAIKRKKGFHKEINDTYKYYLNEKLKADTSKEMV